MKSTEHTHGRANGISRLILWPVCALWLALAVSRVAAVDAYYINNAVVSYPGTADYPPVIDASNFVNNSSFTVNFTFQDFSLTQPFYATSDTVNYTNNGLLMTDTGFQFDTQSANTGLHTRAGNFYNSGTVSCGSVNDTTGSFFGLGLAQCLVNATNIVNHGEVDAGVDGLIQFAGQNADLSQSLLNIEGQASSSGTGFFGLNTNLWDPSANLGTVIFGTNLINIAISPIFPIAPGQLALFPATAYTNFVQQITPQGTNNIIRAVFIQDTSASNVSVSVFFGQPPNPFQMGIGDVTIQWAGSYVDPASGNTYSNYLYLNDDYALGASTNVLPVISWPNGVPPNFTFSEFTTPQMTTLPTSPSLLVNSFQPGGITNLYDVVNAQLASSVSTNSVANHAITNLPGRVQITADKNLDLTLAQISGPNYMSLRSTNQFIGSAGALIQTPFADLDLGVTNGYPTPMYITNVMAGSLPEWGGNVVAWNTRWVVVTGNNTNDYRVLIVSSQVDPTLAAQVQDLILHDTNSVIISDTFNVIRTFNANAQSLTLTTNPIGNGSTSFDGELNLKSQNIFWQSSTPNLRYLTNNGAIRMQNLANFGYPFLTNVNAGVTNVVSFLNNSALINNGIFSDEGSIIYAGNFESSDVFSNGIGSFSLQSLTTTLTNGLLSAGGDVSITTSSLITSNLVLQANRSLTLQTTNLLTDTGVTNRSVWSVGSASVGSGISLPLKPASGGDLLGTVITLSAPTNRTVVNAWAGHDFGISNAGYTNNEAVGELRLDVAGSPIAGHNGVLVFNAPGISNALYVDLLVLTNFATQGNATNNFNFPWLKINTNMMIYFAQALENGLSVAQAIDDQSKIGANGGRLRWISSYAGYFSSTNLIFTNSMGNTFTNTVNTALAQSSTIDSDSDGLVNNIDPTPFFLSSEINFTLTVTNLPPKSAKIQWTTIPNATNFVYYTTNLLSTNWLAFTNFKNWYYGNNVAVTNSTHGNSFRSPQVYPGANPSAPDNGTQTNVWVFDAITNVPHYYKVVVWPWVDFAP